MGRSGVLGNEVFDMYAKGQELLPRPRATSSFRARHLPLYSGFSPLNLLDVTIDAWRLILVNDQREIP